MPIRLTYSVKILIAVSFAAFIVQQTADQFFGSHLLYHLALVPTLFFGEGYIWQLFTYGFIHQGVFQLFFDLLMIAFIGAELETIWGSKRFIQYYFFCLLASGVLYLLIHLIGSGVHSPLLGSSGAIYGLLVAYGLMFGERVLLFMMLFPMKAKHFVWILVALELMTTAYSRGGGWTSVAHLGGMACGFLYLWARAIQSRNAKRGSSGPKKRGSRWSKRSKKGGSGQHLSLVVDNEFGEEDPPLSEDKKPRTWH